MLITAFALSTLFITVGLLGINRNSGFAGFGGLAWIITTTYPGVAGLFFALLSLGVRWIPIIKVAAVPLVWLSFVATFSMAIYALATFLVSLMLE